MNVGAVFALGKIVNFAYQIPMQLQYLPEAGNPGQHRSASKALNDLDFYMGTFRLIISIQKWTLIISEF